MAQGPPRMDGELGMKLDAKLQPGPPGVPRGLAPMAMKVPTAMQVNNIQRAGNLMVAMDGPPPGSRISPEGVPPGASCGPPRPMMQAINVARGGAADFKSNPPFKVVSTACETNNNNNRDMMNAVSSQSAVCGMSSAKAIQAGVVSSQASNDKVSSKYFWHHAGITTL